MNIQVLKPVAVAAEMFLAPQRGGIQDHGRLDGAVLAGGTIKMHSAAFRDLLSDDCLSARSAGVGCGHRSRRRALRADARLRDVSGLTSEPLPLDGRAGRVPAGLKNPRSLTVTTGQERDPRRGVVLSHRAVRTDLPAITLQVARAELGPSTDRLPRAR